MAGVIEYKRGHIYVPNRLVLEQRACECYAAIARELARLSPASAVRHVSYLPNESGVEGIGKGQGRLNDQTWRRIQNRPEFTRRC